MIRIGGNKRFFEFLKEYGKENDSIRKKYSSAAAEYYRKLLCYQAKDIEWLINEKPPMKAPKKIREMTANASDFASHTFLVMKDFAKEKKEQY